MNDLDIVFRVPCGFGPPGELPPPLPGGIDGGIVIPPAPPDGPQPIEPSGPIPPDLPPYEEDLTVVVTQEQVSENSLTCITQSNFTVRLTAFIFLTSNPSVILAQVTNNNLSKTHVINFNGLTPGEQYTYSITVTKNLNWNQYVQYNPATITRTITTNSTPPVDDLEIVNSDIQIIIQNNSPVLNIYWEVINLATNQHIQADSTVIITDLFNNQTIDAFDLIGTVSPFSQSINYPSLIPLRNYRVNIQSFGLGGQSDQLSVDVQCPNYGQPQEEIPVILNEEALFSFSNNSLSLNVGFETVEQTTQNPLNTTAQVILTDQNNNSQTINLSVPDDVHTCVFNNLLVNTVYTITLTAISNTENIDTNIISNLYYDENSPVGNLNTSDGKKYYDQITRSSYTAESEYDLKYTKYSLSPSQFLPTYGEKNSNIFGKIRHYSINRIINKESGTFEEAVIDATNISDDHIKNSLNSSFRRLYNLKYTNGVPVDATKISNIIRRSIETDSVDKLDSDYIQELTKEIPLVNTVRPNITSVEKSRYGISKSSLATNRTISTRSADIDTTVSRNRNYGESLIPKKMLSIDPNKYTDDSKNLLDLWYTLPTDINKRCVFITSSGEENFYVQNTDSIEALDSSGNKVLLELTINDTLQCYITSSEEINIPTESNIANANVLRNDDEHLIMYHLGFDKQVLLTASCPDVNVEITSSVNPPLSHYILQLNTSTIIDDNSELSPFIKETDAYYNIVTSSQQDIQDLNDDIIYRAYPWLVLTINHDDPIWDYFDYSNSSVSGTTFKFTFRDVTYDGFGFKDDETDPFLVRKIPRFIVITPTNRTFYNFYNANSLLKDWNVRELRWEMSPDKKLNDIGLLQHPFEVLNSYIHSEGESKSGDYSTQSYICRYGDTTNYTKTYKNPEEIPERELDPVRAAVIKVEEIKENYEIDNGITWYDLLARLDRKHMYTLNKRADVKVINKLKNGEKTNTKIYHVKSPKNKDASSRRNPTRIVSSKGLQDIQLSYAIEVPVRPPVPPEEESLL